MPSLPKSRPDRKKLQSLSTETLERLVAMADKEIGRHVQRLVVEDPAFGLVVHISLDCEEELERRKKRL